MNVPKPRLGVFKFASCDGCQLSILDCEDEILAVADRVEIAYFLEATRRPLEGRFDVSLVEGSISSPEQLEQIKDVRERSKFVVTIGACANGGGIQGLRNFISIEESIAAVYANPSYVKTLEKSRPIADFITVDLELQGCPINKHQLLNVIAQMLAGARPRVPDHAVCLDCKRRNIVCVVVSQGKACMGPVTSTGCGALCPAHDRGCFACYGPSHQPNTAALASRFESIGVPSDQIRRFFHAFYSTSPAFVAEGLRHV